MFSAYLSRYSALTGGGGKENGGGESGVMEITRLTCGHGYLDRKAGSKATKLRNSTVVSPGRVLYKYDLSAVLF